MNNKEEKEEILCCKSGYIDYFFHTVNPDGYTKIDNNEMNKMVIELFSLFGRFRPRPEVESDPAYRQVVAYGVITKGDRVFVTYRTGGDDRLIKQYSIGVGGHINGYDFLVYDGLWREVKEEVGLKKEDASTKMIGVISSNKSEVDKCHIGVVYNIVLHPDADEDFVKVLERDKMNGRWMTMEELTTLYVTGQLESWSEIVYRNYLNPEVRKNED